MKRVALGLLIAVALAACGGSSGASSGPSAVPAPTDAASSAPSTASANAISVTLSDFEITPDAVTSGTAITIAVTSDGPTPHNLTIRDADDEVVAATDDLSTGESDTIDVELEAGEYETFCSLPGHESLGMRGTLTVAAP